MPDAKEAKEWPKIADLTVDICLFTFDKTWGLPKVLLIKRSGETFHGYWALPGGFVDPGETFVVAAYRELNEETGLSEGDVELVRLDIRDDPDRDPRGRSISIVFGAFVPPELAQKCVAGSDADEVDWKYPAADDFPHPLAFDHDEAIRVAYLTLLQLPSQQKFLEGIY